jgi:hypothetical protein
MPSTSPTGSSAREPVRAHTGRRVLVALAALAFALVALELGWRVWLQRTGRGFFDAGAR